MPQTTTSVHSSFSQKKQRLQIYMTGKYQCCALTLCAQLLVGYACFLMEHTATPSYFSVLLFIIPSLIFFAVFFILCRFADVPHLFHILQPLFLGRCLLILLSLSFFIDAVDLLCAASSLLGEVLPTVRRWLITPLFSLLCFFSLYKNKPYALIRMAGFVFFPLLFLLLLSAFPALNQGSFHHFFPILGKGMSSILEGAFFLCGNLSLFCAPLILPNHFPDPERKKSFQHMGILFCALLFCLLIVLLYSCILPFYALSQPMTIGARLLLPIRISSSVALWSVFVCAMVLLLMLSYTVSLSNCVRLLSIRKSDEKNCPNHLTVLLFFLTLPLPMLYSRNIQRFLIFLYPYRAVPALLLLVTGPFFAYLYKKKGKKAS